MKTTRILLLSATFLLFPWCVSQLLSQQEGDKKIVITKRTVDANGAESSETIVKKGAAAENFDVDKYIKENRADNTQVEVKVTGGDDERTIVIKGSKMASFSGEDNEDEDDDDNNADTDPPKTHQTGSSSLLMVPALCRITFGPNDCQTTGAQVL